MARQRRGGRAAGAVLGQGKDGGAAGVGADPGIGMDRHEQVGVHLARLLHALGERYEVVAIARQQHAHLRVVAHQRGEPARHGQRDRFFTGAAAAGCARILAAVAGVDGDRDQASRCGRALAWPLGGSRRLHRALGTLDLAIHSGLVGRRSSDRRGRSGRLRRRPVVRRLLGGWLLRGWRLRGWRLGGWLRGRGRLADQRHQRIGRVGRVKGEQQPVAVGADRIELVQLRSDIAL